MTQLMVKDKREKKRSFVFRTFCMGVVVSLCPLDMHLLPVDDVVLLSVVMLLAKVLCFLYGGLYVFCIWLDIGKGTP